MNTASHAARRYVLASLLLGLTVSLSAQQAGIAPDSLTHEQMEALLLKGKVVSTREIGKGINNTRRVTLSDGTITHDAHIQTVNVSKHVFQPAKGPAEINFRDTYRYNIAGYRLARMLGLKNVPVSVERSALGVDGSFTWWVDDVRMDEGQRRKGSPPEWPQARTSAQIHLMRVFDALIANTDRNMGNLLWTSDGTMWMIDHTRAFRLSEKVPAPAILVRCERTLLERMRKLTSEDLKAAMEDFLSGEEIKAMLKRRDQIVELFDSKIAQRGEATILFTLDAVSAQPAR